MKAILTAVLLLPTVSHAFTYECALRNPVAFNQVAQNAKDNDRYHFKLSDHPGMDRTREFKTTLDNRAIQVDVFAQWGFGIKEPRVFVDVTEAKGTAAESRISTANGKDLNTYTQLVPGGEWGTNVGVECDLVENQPAP
ncbi:hypothetical protein K2X33_02715 [bacterium]|nr:hypothetical protein [bacterium]